MSTKIFNYNVVEEECLKKGDIVYCNLNTIGYDSTGRKITNMMTIGKTRPVLVIYKGEIFSVVLPIKTDRDVNHIKGENYYEIEYEAGYRSLICLNQVRQVDNRQFSTSGEICTLKKSVFEDILIKFNDSYTDKNSDVLSDPLYDAKDALYKYVIGRYGNMNNFKECTIERPLQSEIKISKDTVITSKSSKITKPSHNVSKNKLTSQSKNEEFTPEIFKMINSLRIDDKLNAEKICKQVKNSKYFVLGVLHSGKYYTDNVKGAVDTYINNNLVSDSGDNIVTIKEIYDDYIKYCNSHIVGKVNDIYFTDILAKSFDSFKSERSRRYCRGIGFKSKKIAIS